MSKFKHIILILSQSLICILFALQCVYSQHQDMEANQIPVRYEGHIYVHAEVSGHSGNFLLDTGADYLYLDSIFYANHHWDFKNITHALLPGAGEKPKEIEYILDSVKLKFGAEHFATPGVPVLDLKSIVGDVADGIIGLGYFKDQILEVDYQNQTLKTYMDITKVNLEGFEKIELEISNNRMLVPLSVSITPELNIDGSFLLDFGTSRNVILTSLCAKANNLSDVIRKKARYYSSHAGVGGESSGYDFRASTVKLGTNLLNGVVMDYALDESGALASNEYTGLLGNGILDRFQIIIDYGGQSLYLKPLDRLSERFYASATGFSISDRSKTLGAWVITHMHKGEQAESAGLRMGDYITHVDNVPVAEISYQERVAWHQSQKLIEMRVERENSKPFQISIKLKEII